MVKRVHRPIALRRRVHHFAAHAHFQHHLRGYVVGIHIRRAAIDIAAMPVIPAMPVAPIMPAMPLRIMRVGMSVRMRALFNHRHEVHKLKRRLIAVLHPPHKQFKRRLRALILEPAAFQQLYALQQLPRLRFRQVGVRTHLARLPQDIPPARQVRHQHAVAVADVLRRDVLVATLHLGHRRRVQPALVRECAAAHIRLRGRLRHIGDFGDIAARLGQRRQLRVRYAVHAQFQLEIGDERNHIGVAAALAVAVHCALNLLAARLHGGDCARHRHIRVVVRMYAQRRVGMPPCFCHNRRDFVGQRAAVGIAQHDALRARQRRRANRLQRVLRVCLVAVKVMLGVKEHPPAALRQKRHRIRNHSQIFFQRCLQHALHMQIPALAHQRSHIGFGGEQRGEIGVVRGADIGVARAAESRQRGMPQPQRLGALKELRVARIGSGPSPLNEMNAQLIQLAADRQLILHRQRYALPLRAIPQRSVIQIHIRYIRHPDTCSSCVCVCAI